MWKSRRLSVGISTKRLIYNFAYRILFVISCTSNSNENLSKIIQAVTSSRGYGMYYYLIDYQFSKALCAAATRAMGTRKGEQLT